MRNHKRSRQGLHFTSKLWQPHPPDSLLTEKQRNVHQPGPWSRTTQLSTHEESSYTVASPSQGSGGTPDSFSILTINVSAEQQNLQPQAESLDSRIESLLTNSEIPSGFHIKTLEPSENSRDSPASSCSAPTEAFSAYELFALSPHGPFRSSPQHSCNDLVDVSPTSLSESDKEQFLLEETSQRPSEMTPCQRSAYRDGDKAVETSHLLCSKVISLD